MGVGRKGTSRELRAGLGLGICLIFVAGASTAHAAVSAVDSGSLKASVTERPWSLSLTDRRGRSVLKERPGLGANPVGSLGFRFEGKWKHATRVIRSGRKGRTWRARLATTYRKTDLAVKLAPAGEGSIRLKVHLIGVLDGISGVGMGFRAPKGEHYLGFGERSNAVDQSGGVVENFVGEGPYRADEHELVSGFVPPWSKRTTEDATYYPMPWLLSTAGYGVLIEETLPSYFRLRTDRPDTWSLEVTGSVTGLANAPEPMIPQSLSVRFFAGPKPAGALRRMSEATGRQPAPAPWFLGPWVQSKNGDQNTIDTLRANDVPTSVAQTYTHYLPCGDQVGNTYGMRERTALFHGAGLAVTTYFNPMVCTDYQPVYGELAANGDLTTDSDGDPYEYRYLGFDVGQFNFTTRSSRESYGDLLDEALVDGYDGWMEDFGEYTPLDSFSPEGTAAGLTSHNRYPRDYHCAAHEQTRNHVRPVLRFIRSGWTGTAKCAPVVWGGDPSTDWGFDGLRSAVINGLTMGLSGVGIWGSDIGGFFSIKSPPLSPELLTRWVQFGAFSGAMRNQSNGFRLGAGVRPQILDPDQIGNWRRYSKLRTQLYPYIRAAAAQYRKSGMPMMRALALTNPGDARAVAQQNQYMFGPDLLVAPVTEPGTTERRLYLPKGKWIDLWRSLSYDEESGSFDVEGAWKMAGNRSASVPAPADEIPVLARAGTLLPMLPPGVDTLAPFGSKDESVARLGDQDRRKLIAFPRGTSTARVETRGWIGSREFRKSWQLRIRDTTNRRWEVAASLDSLRTPFTPRCVFSNARRLPRRAWSFQPKGRILRMNLRTVRRAIVVVVTAKRC